MKLHGHNEIIYSLQESAYTVSELHRSTVHKWLRTADSYQFMLIVRILENTVVVDIVDPVAMLLNV